MVRKQALNRSAETELVLWIVDNLRLRQYGRETSGTLVESEGRVLDSRKNKE